MCDVVGAGSSASQLQISHADRSSPGQIASRHSPLRRSRQPAPPQSLRHPRAPFPRFEFFVGGSYAEAGLFNAGHWAGLAGWDASLGVNLTHWIGVRRGWWPIFWDLARFRSRYRSRFRLARHFVLLATHFNAATREYNILFGVQFARRKYGTLDADWRSLVRTSGNAGIATAPEARRCPEDRHGPRDRCRRGPRPQINRALRAAVEGRLLPDRTDFHCRQKDAGQLPVFGRA